MARGEVDIEKETQILNEKAKESADQMLSSIMSTSQEEETEK
ncbi:hypothetical protein ASZ84_03193 [Vibrio cholerae]|nr:hypothetical protein ASZ84_03193 [Vibrio cholerae]APF76774.1 hypothetical protein ASZ83_02982 [Vibrio cholerae]APF80768.1 hypothetical protein ASZ85_03277 [Vibrio cholerae]EAZ74655.1 hypothetical protein A5C_A0523 [Vibrio cholerae NCTC 8457]BAP04713.1 hypothetical protein MS6_A0454 [Vibrio cholerae MS6]